jgi:hypothetical protein
MKNNTSQPLYLATEATYIDCATIIFKQLDDAVAIATARWRHHWASRDTCSGPNRCPDRVDGRTSALLNPANVNAIMMFTGSVKDDYGRKLR